MVGCLFVTLFLLWGSGANTVALFIPPLIKQFGWSRTQVSLLFAFLALASGISSPLAGWLLERLEARGVIAAGAIVSGLGLLAASRANSFGAIVVGYVALGFGLGLSTFVPAAIVVSNWFGERRGFALGIVMAGQSLGGMVMASFVSHAIAAGGWRAGETVLAVPMLLVVAPLVFGFLRSRPPEEALSSIAQNEIDTLPGLEVAEALRTRSFWMIALAQAFFAFAVGGAYVHLVAYLIEAGYGQSAAALSLSLVLLFATVGQPLLGVIADRIGGRFAYALAFGMLAASLVMLAAADQTVVLGLFVLIFGLVAAGPIVLAPIVVAESLGLKRYGSLMGLVGFPFTLGLALGPLAAGGIYDLTASYGSAFKLFFVISLLGIVASLICVPLKWESVSVAAAGGQEVS